MNKNTVKNFKVAPKAEPKKPGLFARVSGWIKGLVSKTVAAVKTTAGRVKAAVTSAAKKTYKYVVPPMHEILQTAVAWTAAIVFVTMFVIAPLQMIAFSFTAIGVTTVALVAWAYLAALQETRPWARTVLKICAVVLGLVGFCLELMVLVAAFSSGLWMSLALALTIGATIYLYNEWPRILAVARERSDARKEAKAAKRAVAEEAQLTNLVQLLDSLTRESVPNPS